MSIPREAVEAATREMRRFFNQSVPNLDYDQGAQDIITAALPYLRPRATEHPSLAHHFAAVRAEERAAKDAEIAPLQIDVKSSDLVAEQNLVEREAYRAEVAALREALAEFMAQQPFDSDRDQLAARRAARAALEMSGGVK